MEMMTMKVETIGQETIKPSSPTPDHLRTVNLSVFDQLTNPLYTFACLFYSRCSDDQKQSTLFSEQNTTSQKLKTSLSETLTRFYPLAGTINDGVCIDCNDEGAVFVDARVDCTLAHFLKSPDFVALQRFLPLDVVENPAEAAATWPLLLVKATYFQCGGLAIAVCISHKIADAASLSTFIRTWTAIARGDGDSVRDPEFTSAEFFPPATRDTSKNPQVVQMDKKICVTKRFVFEAAKIALLKAKAASADVAEPTRVATVTALLWKCIAAASDKSLPKVLGQPMNLRPKIPSLLSENVIGNLLYFLDFKMDQQGEVKLDETVRELGRKAKEFEMEIADDGGSATDSGMKIIGLMMKNTSGHSSETPEIFGVSSWCKLPFYEASFGWGTPVWVAGNIAPTSDYWTVLMDSRDGKGMETWVTLPEEYMSCFEQNSELLAFASPNPTVLLQ